MTTEKLMEITSKRFRYSDLILYGLKLRAVKARVCQQRGTRDVYHDGHCHMCGAEGAQ